MKKLRKLTMLFLFSMIVSVSAYGVNVNEQVEKNTTLYSNYSPNESNETSELSFLEPVQDKNFAFFVGYTGNFKNSNRTREKNNKYNHIIEAGFGYNKQMPSKLGYSLYAGGDLLFNSRAFGFGPKVGANASYSIVMLGSEFITYTDARFARFYCRPYVGIGVGPLKISAGYNIGIANTATFKEINSFTLGLTVPLFWSK